MISQQELPSVVQSSIPELSATLEKDHCGNAYYFVRQLLQYTITQVRQNNLNAAKKCLALAERLYRKGNSAIKNAVENVYVYSFSHAFFYDEQKRQDVMKIVPASLYELYKKQVISSHL